VQGKTVYLTTTAPADIASQQAEHLTGSAGCTVVGFSANLADRTALRADLEAAPEYDVLLTELKAAAVDVAAEHAIGRGASVVFVDNRPVGVDAEQDLRTAVEDVVRTATERYEQRV
jgi:cyclic 2,3-diphosphoglycerate synthetase